MHLYKRNKKFLVITTDDVWSSLPYSREELVSHISALFEPWMNWDNNGAPNKNMRTWQLDHIMPKASFDYLSLSDASFIECWGLSNLKPIEAQVNQAKSSHKDYNSAAFNTLRNCLKHNKETKRWNVFFDFPLSIYREHIEKQFIDGMSWDNHGEWHIDHSMPCAALPFEDIKDENFKKLWDYKNLSPKFASHNLSKGSTYQNKKYFILK
jgi:hypothetical protein